MDTAPETNKIKPVFLDDEEEKHLNEISKSATQVLKAETKSSGIDTGIPVLEVKPVINQSPVQDKNLLNLPHHQAAPSYSDPERKVDESEFEDLMMGLRNKPRTAESGSFLEKIKEKLTKKSGGGQVKVID